MAKESLIERAVEKNADIKQSDSIIEGIVSEVCTEEATIKYKCLDDSGWNELCKFTEVARGNINNIIKDSNLCVFSDEREKLKEFSLACSSAWDDKKEMFRIKPTYDEDGHLSSLVVPLNSSISDDLTVVNIHDDKGRFVADDIENQIDCEMHELQTKDMYIKNGKYVYVGLEDSKTLSDTLTSGISFSQTFLDKESTDDRIIGIIDSIPYIIVQPIYLFYLIPHLSTYLQSISPLVATIVILTTCGIANFVMGHLLAVGVISTKRAIINNNQKKVERFFEV